MGLMEKEKKLIKLKKVFEFIIIKACILDDCFEGIVLATGHNLESNFAEGPHCTLGGNISEEHFKWRNLLGNKIIRLFTIQTSFSTIRTVGHNLQITTIQKL